ncbi:ATP-binding protein [Acetobacteraceae bacterium KSS8]|uniref:ATP-binding protein n=1 Tax=Endosaccharibacter trunci TaxID=2812733 RepID=A0ABT1W7P5_9PROT|nr:ATP-binding protein [Acetobacteraceae bacterium KSS8]
MYPLASLVRDSFGRFTFRNGILHALPVELCDAPRIGAYCRVDQAGWSVSEFGYHVYAQFLPRGELIIFPALILIDGSKVLKKFYNYSVSFKKIQIEKMVEGIIENYRNVQMTALRGQGILIHDLRALSDSIYHSAVEASSLNDQKNYHECKKRIENILASQGMLQMRADALDFVGNALPNSVEDYVPVFKKVDKVVRCFKSRAAGRRKSVNLYGNSYKRTWGAAILELVPYGLIDNGLKYCPEEGRVDVQVRDELDKTIVSVSSFGPKIEESEKSRIFTEGMRGVSAISTNLPGEGIGLYMVEKITRETFGGSVSVYQEETPVLFGDSTAYFQTTFEVVLPSW